MYLELECIFIREIVWKKFAGPFLFERELEVSQERQVLKLMYKHKTVKINRKDEVQSLWTAYVNNFMLMTVKNFLIQQLVSQSIILWDKQGWFFRKDNVCSNNVNTVSLNSLFELENFLEINPENSLVQRQPTLILEWYQSRVFASRRNHFVFLVKRVVLGDVWFLELDGRWRPNENALLACFKTEIVCVGCFWIMFVIFDRNESVQSQEFVSQILWWMRLTKKSLWNLTELTNWYLQGSDLFRIVGEFLKIIELSFITVEMI